jgi:trehalose 6-phosphate phosphatase
VAERQAHELLAPLRGQPSRCALLFDVDGTLAPIVDDPNGAAVPAATRELLAELERRYALIACLSGRRAAAARRVVGVNSITYVGNHGLEHLAPGSELPEIAEEAAEFAPAVRSFASSAYTGELREAGVRIEDKDSIWSFHWREAPDEVLAREQLEAVAKAAIAAGLAAHWGRKVLEIRPPVAVDKGTAVERVIERAQVSGALYGGDDRTDVDAFRKLRELGSSGVLAHAVCVGIGSDEGPAAIVDEADLVVEGPEGFRKLLATL